MDNLLVSGVSYFVQNALLTPLQRFLFSVLSYIAQQGLAFARLPFVVSTADSMAVWPRPDHHPHGVGSAEPIHFVE